ncbi:SDR family oxidoreductase [Streptomyces sp. NPDC059818]|uniref:SDR family oxidoreductase n=1 Tax=Streptomyces sp. NPDC059818 TaxID=3346962 RepID=UPI0036573923
MEAPAASAVPSSRRCWPPGTRRSPARRTSSLDDLAARYGDRLLTVPLDVTDPAQAEAAVGATVDAFGRIDVVVNNAGYADIAPVEEGSLDSFRAQIDAVFLGTVHVTKAALPVFRRQGNGYFIQVTSVGGRGTAPGLSAYQSASSPSRGSRACCRRRWARWASASRWPSRAHAHRQGRVVHGDPGLRLRLRTHGRRTRRAPAETTGKEPIDPAEVARVFLDLADRPRSSHLAAPWPQMTRGRRHRRR